MCFSVQIDEFSLTIKRPLFKARISTKGVFIFHPPEKLLKIGSFMFDTSANFHIDIAVEIPKVNVTIIFKRYK